ncbi:MAG: PEP-CTERM sorting domain-containing protein [Thermoguttaceae bacterium]
MIRFAGVLAVIAVLAATTWARASVSIVAGEYVVMSAGSQQYVYNDETGGEFGMTITDSGGNPIRDSHNNPQTLYTFCADPTTLMSYGPAYFVSAVTTENYLKYSLGDFGKWIYYEYAESNVYIDGHNHLGYYEAGAIQEGIWQQLTNGSTNELANSGWMNDSNYLTYIAPMIAGWYTDYKHEVTANPTDWQNFLNCEDGIEIAQLQLNGDAQNQMVWTVVNNPHNGITPEPATIVIWSLLGGIGLAIGWRRRKRAV